MLPGTGFPSSYIFTHTQLIFYVFSATRRRLMEFGRYGGFVYDAKESFEHNGSLENFYMQAFIDCLRHDDAAHLPAPITDRLILDADVGVHTPFLSPLQLPPHPS